MDDNANATNDPATMLCIGQHETRRSEEVTSDLLNRAQSVGYDMLTSPITTAHFQSRVLDTLKQYVDGLTVNTTPINAVPLPLISSLTPQDTHLTPEGSNALLIAVTSSWIDLGSPDPLIAHLSRQVLNMELAYAAFCGINNVILHGPISSTGTMQYARAVQEALGLGPYLQLHILLPMTGELEEDISAEGAHLAELARSQYMSDADDEDDEDDLYGAWELWNTVQVLCSYSTRLSIALELPRLLPSVDLQSRWYAEPVRLLLLPRTSFLRNAKGFPVLSTQHQQYLTRFLRLRFPPWALLSDVGPIPNEDVSNGTGHHQEPTPAEATAKAAQRPDDTTLHLKYMRHLQQTQPSRPPIERFGQGYQDYLQSPLQPLTDNLESITYEVFEKDPIKYDWYERAVALALKDLRSLLGEDREIVVAVVGAGRGPLVTRALLASRSTGIRIKCCAVEKNPNAHVLLQRRNATDPLWDNNVTVVKSDMRAWLGPMLSNGDIGKVDILVSELLGSFADNELSPECLDGVQHVLHPDHGINIPQSYSAHLTPIAAPKLHSELLSRASPIDMNMTTVDKWELPYVVMLHQLDYLSHTSGTQDAVSQPSVQEAWSFSHPIPAQIIDQSHRRAGGSTDAGGWVGGDGSNEHNSRSCKLRFPCPNRGICHGLGGYFESVLYRSKDGTTVVELSTNPDTMDAKSKDMISWFPIFFPLKTPITVVDDAELEVTMWRQTDDRKVWYEWVVEVFEYQDVKDGGIKRRKLGMSELHSSRKNGCLM